MFGFVVADAGALSEKEKERYRAVYCGLCLALRDRYGQLSRACLTYDLTFFVLPQLPARACRDAGREPLRDAPGADAPRPWARSAYRLCRRPSVALAYSQGETRRHSRRRRLEGPGGRAPACSPAPTSGPDTHPRAVRRDRAGYGGHPSGYRARGARRTTPMRQPTSSGACSGGCSPAIRFLEHRRQWKFACLRAHIFLPDGRRRGLRRRRRFRQLQPLRGARLGRRGRARHAGARCRRRSSPPASACRWCRTRHLRTHPLFRSLRKSSTRPIRRSLVSKTLKCGTNHDLAFYGHIARSQSLSPKGRKMPF